MTTSISDDIITSYVTKSLHVVCLQSFIHQQFEFSRITGNCRENIPHTQKPTRGSVIQHPKFGWVWCRNWNLQGMFDKSNCVLMFLHVCLKVVTVNTYLWNDQKLIFRLATSCRLPEMKFRAWRTSIMLAGCVWTCSQSNRSLQHMLPNGCGHTPNISQIRY